VKGLIRSVAVSGLAVLLTACAAGHYEQSQIDRALERHAEPVKEYRIGPSDVLQINVWRNPDLSAQVPVRPDGRISMPLLGDVEARGLTPEELASTLKERLDEFVRQPQVSVTVSQMGSHEFTHRVRVTGAVREPASQPYREGMTVMDVVLGAGGANEFASLNRATLYRELDNEVVAIPVRLGDILNRGKIETNYRLVPGDILTVPERRF